MATILFLNVRLFGPRRATSVWGLFRTVGEMSKRTAAATSPPDAIIERALNLSAEASERASTVY